MHTLVVFLQIACLSVAFGAQVTFIGSLSVMCPEMVFEVAVFGKLAAAPVDQAGEEEAVARVLRVGVSLDFEPGVRDSFKLILL